MHFPSVIVSTFAFFAGMFPSSMLSDAGLLFPVVFNGNTTFLPMLLLSWHSTAPPDPPPLLSTWPACLPSDFLVYHVLDLPTCTIAANGTRLQSPLQPLTLASDTLVSSTPDSDTDPVSLSLPPASKSISMPPTPVLPLPHRSQVFLELARPVGNIPHEPCLCPATLSRTLLFFSTGMLFSYACCTAVHRHRAGHTDLYARDAAPTANPAPCTLSAHCPPDVDAFATAILLQQNALLAAEIKLVGQKVELVEQGNADTAELLDQNTKLAAAIKVLRQKAERIEQDNAETEELLQQNATLATAINSLRQKAELVEQENAYTAELLHQNAVIAAEIEVVRQNAELLELENLATTRSLYGQAALAAANQALQQQIERLQQQVAKKVSAALETEAAACQKEAELEQATSEVVDVAKRPYKDEAKVDTIILKLVDEPAEPKAEDDAVTSDPMATETRSPVARPVLSTPSKTLGLMAPNAALRPTWRLKKEKNVEDVARQSPVQPKSESSSPSLFKARPRSKAVKPKIQSTSVAALKQLSEVRMILQEEDAPTEPQPMLPAAAKDNLHASVTEIESMALRQAEALRALRLDVQQTRPKTMSYEEVQAAVSRNAELEQQLATAKVTLKQKAADHVQAEQELATLGPRKVALRREFRIGLVIIKNTEKRVKAVTDQLNAESKAQHARRRRALEKVLPQSRTPLEPGRAASDEERQTQQVLVDARPVSGPEAVQALDSAANEERRTQQVPVDARSQGGQVEPEAKSATHIQDPFLDTPLSASIEGSLTHPLSTSESTPQSANTDTPPAASTSDAKASTGTTSISPIIHSDSTLSPIPGTSRSTKKPQKVVLTLSQFLCEST